MRRSFTTVSLLSDRVGGPTVHGASASPVKTNRASTTARPAAARVARWGLAELRQALLAKVGQARQLLLQVEPGDAPAGALGRDAAAALALLGVAALGHLLRADAAHPLH